MRVGIDVSSLTRTRTGVGNYTHSLLKCLVDDAGDTQFHAFSSGVRVITLRGAQGPALASHRHIHVPTRVLYRLWNVLGWPRVDRLLGGVDVYHATNYFLPPTATARRVVTFYDLAFLRIPECCSPKIIGPFSRNVARFAREADAVLTCSEAAKRDIVELLDVPGEKISVAYGAVEDDFIPMDRASAAVLLKRHYGVSGPFLLFVSTLEPRKNVEGLVRAFAKVAHDIPHNLVLVGASGWRIEGLEHAFRESGLGDRVQRVGYVIAREHLPAFYSAADAFVFPSFYEGFGLPVLEAMVCGCPVITSNRSSLPEVAGGAAEYVDPDNTDEIAEAIRRVVVDESLAASMRERGRAQASRFSWQDCARRTQEVYRRLGGCMS